ncbi:MAG: hypothetical protein Q8Q92_03325 [bacterium]|nr:hypothetical protein [bacterium]
MTKTQQTVLNIAVNLDRLSRWAQENRPGRVKQFIKDTDVYIGQLEETKLRPKFAKTFKAFKESFSNLKLREIDDNWAEDSLTWANILTHRAKLA